MYKPETKNHTILSNKNNSIDNFELRIGRIYYKYEEFVAFINKILKLS